MNTPLYSDSHKKKAKRLRRLAREELGIDHPEWSYTRCLGIIAGYERNGMGTEEFVAHIYVEETKKGRGVPDDPH